MNNLSRYALLVLCSAALAGCSSVRDTLGLEHDAPDEYAVLPSSPLTMPPDYTLRPPTPGVERPQTVKAEDRARNALMGTSAQPLSDQTNPGSAEGALLQGIKSPAKDDGAALPERSLNYASRSNEAIPQPEIVKAIQDETSARAEPAAEHKPLWQMAREASAVATPGGPTITLQGAATGFWDGWF